MGDSQRTQAIAILRRFGSLSEQAMALTSTICPHRLLSTQSIAQALPHGSYRLPRLYHSLPNCQSIWSCFRLWPLPSFLAISLQSMHQAERSLSLLSMAMFRLQLLLLPLDYCPSFSAISLCFIDTTHSQDNGHSLTSTIAISRLNYKVPRPLGG